MTPHEELLAHEKLCAERYSTIHKRLDRIESMLNRLIWGILIAFGSIILMLVSSELKAEEANVPELMATTTDVGFIFLSVDPCPQQMGPFYEYFTVATEQGHQPHLGCWNVDGPLVIIWWFELDHPVSYDKFEFSPWTGPKPEL